MNRLLINMRNKIDSLNDAIDLVNRLERGETIKIRGLLNAEYDANENANKEDFESARKQLRAERNNLQHKVYIMCGEYY